MFYGKLNNPEDRKFLNDALLRFRGMFNGMFAGDNVIMFSRTLGWRRNRRFVEAMNKNVTNQQERSLELRLNTLTWAVDHALNYEGDFVECGVWKGFCSAVLTDYLDFKTLPRTFYLYDTFGGIPEEWDSEKHNSPLFAQEGLYEQVVERFKPHPNVRVIRGVIPESFNQACPDKIAFLHIDLNSSAAEIAALEVLFDRVVPGGVIVFDDYGWLGYVKQQLAEDSWLAARGHRVLELPSGQGVVIKH